MIKFTIPISVFEAKVSFGVDVKPDDKQEWLEDDMYGITLKHPNGNAEIYLWDKDDLRAVVHEINHAVFHILECRGVKDEEAHCYLHDYIVVQYRKKVDKIITKSSGQKNKNK